MFNDDKFKMMLGKMIERDAESSFHSTDEKQLLISALNVSKVHLDKTDDFAYMGWNTLATYLRLTVPFDKIDLFEDYEDTITEIARNLYGKQGDNVLKSTHISPLSDDYEIIDFNQISISDEITQAIEDAEIFMSNGKYDSAFDRVHTAFHGYLIEILRINGVEINKKDNLTKLYGQIQPLIEKKIDPIELSEIIKSTIRGANGMISSLNQARNNYSLAHPNKSLIGKNEAKLIISIVSGITNYIDEYLN